MAHTKSSVYLYSWPSSIHIVESWGCFLRSFFKLLCSSLHTHACVNLVISAFLSICCSCMCMLIGMNFLSACLMTACSCEYVSFVLKFVCRFCICMLCVASLLIMPRFPWYLGRHNLWMADFRCNALLFLSVFLVNMSGVSISVIVHYMTPSEYVKFGNAQLIIHLILYLAFSCVRVIIIIIYLTYLFSA